VRAAAARELLYGVYTFAVARVDVAVVVEYGRTFYCHYRVYVRPVEDVFGCSFSATESISVRAAYEHEKNRMEHVTAQGVEVPALGIGTGRIAGEECADAVESALELGYRRVDTAQMYGNEGSVGEGIERASVDRDDVFLTTKLNRNIVESMGYKLVGGSLLGTGV